MRCGAIVMRVSTGVVTGMPRCLVTCWGSSHEHVWTTIPSRRFLRPLAPRTTTSIVGGSRSTIPHSAAALAPKSAAPSPQLSTAAIQRP